jgi:hypothetical protein
MPNQDKNAYSLVAFCPIKSISEGDNMSVFKTRKVLQDLPTGVNSPVSPMASVPNTYLARFFILDDILFQSYPHHLDSLKSKYLVFAANIHGDDLDVYLEGMYNHMEKEIKAIWAHCVAFEQVKETKSFCAYIKKCQVTTTYFFNGSTDDSLAEQLKSLYLKQEFSKFVFAHQGLSAAKIQDDFKEFCRIHKPMQVEGPTWRAGVSNVEDIVRL